MITGYVVVWLVEALHYKPEDRGFFPLWGQGTFYWLNASGCTMALGSTQSLTKMSTRDISWRGEVAGA